MNNVASNIDLPHVADYGSTGRGALLLSPVMPDPNGSGPQRRAFQWILQLSRSSPVHLVVVTDNIGFGVPSATAELLASASILPAEIPGILDRVLYVAVPWLAAWSHRGVDLWRTTKSFQRDSDSVAWPVQIDRIIVFRLYLHDLAMSLRGKWAHDILTEMDLDDLESNTRLSIARIAMLRKRPLTFISGVTSALQYRIIERRCLSNYHTVYLASNQDVELLRSRLPALTIEPMPNRVLKCSIMPPRILNDSALPTFLFIGTLGYLPNEDACLWLAEEIIPALRDALSRRFRLIIAGRGASEMLRQRLARCPEVDFRGEVKELDTLYAESHAALIPLRGGGGTKLKLLEAFRYCCPAIATMHGVRGSGARQDEHYLAAETANDFAQQCARLLRNPQLGPRLASSALILLEHNFLQSPITLDRFA